MYGHCDESDATIYGILAVRPRPLSRPVAVKLLLSRTEVAMPSLDEAGIEKARTLARVFYS
jgi:hypothetical protein